MNVRPSILCPIDFSEASTGALRYAAAIATHFATRLIVLVGRRSLADRSRGPGHRRHVAARRLQARHASLCGENVRRGRRRLVRCSSMKWPSESLRPEILRVARERSCDLIVISTHGLTGMRKLFFGSTTERVLRETTRPVLVTPPHDPGPIQVEDAKRLLHRVVVPVDLSPASLHQTQVARGIAEALSLPLLVVHVIEPLKSRLAARLHGSGIEANRRSLAEEALSELIATVPPRLRPEALVAYGDPAEELAKVAHDRQAGLVVVGLHGSPAAWTAHGIGDLPLLCLSQTPVLALPPNAWEAHQVRVPERSAVAEHVTAE